MNVLGSLVVKGAPLRNVVPQHWILRDAKYLSNDTNRLRHFSPYCHWRHRNTSTPLTSGVPVTGIALSANTSKLYSIAVPAGRTTLTFKTTGGTGDLIFMQIGFRANNHFLFEEI